MTHIRDVEVLLGKMTGRYTGGTLEELQCFIRAEAQTISC